MAFYCQKNNGGDLHRQYGIPSISGLLTGSIFETDVKMIKG